jgi:UDP-2,4-diacetamido-2,4,6-trideoxy-beta-L-altropyranose hydrolase
MTKNILIRCDSSNIIGTGHIMRCLNLCEYYPDNNFTFLCRNFNMNISSKIKNNGYNLILLDYNIEPELNNYKSWIGTSENDEIIDFQNIIKYNTYDIILIDHYGINSKIELEIKKYTNKLIVISDIFEKNHFCDIFINYNCDDLNKVMKINLNDKTIYKIGYQNIILNKKFIYSNRKNTFNNEIKVITINMGGSDPQNYILKVIENINDYIIEKDIIVNIIIGKSNNNIESINNFINNSNYKLFFDINYDELINLHINSDLAIGSLSITAYERLYLNIPQISLKIVENQLIQQLQQFNIIDLKDLMNKILDYSNIYINNINNNNIKKNIYNVLSFFN